MIHLDKATEDDTLLLANFALLYKGFQKVQILALPGKYLFLYKISMPIFLHGDV